MRFTVDRTSSPPTDPEHPPLRGAKLVPFPREQMEYVSPAFPAQEVLVWVIDVASLEELLRLIATSAAVTWESQFIVGTSGLVRDVPHIEVYDDYRE